MKTLQKSVQLKTEIHKQLKAISEKSGIKIRHLVNEALKAFIELQKDGE